MRQSKPTVEEEILRFFQDVFSGNMREYKDGRIDNEKFKALSEEKRKMLYTKKISKKNRTLDVKEISRQMTVLHYISSKLKIKPFEGKRFIIILHFLKDIIPFLKCCEKCGLDPSETLLFYKEYLYPHRDLIKNYLESQNYERIHSLDSIDEVLREVQDIWQKNEKPILIIEDGGYVVPRVHTRFKTIGKKVIGAVEQTTKGEKEDRNIEKEKKLHFPVLSLASSRFKASYEPPHIAREVVHSIQGLIRRDLSSRPVLLIGYGRIGSEIARELKPLMDVTVTDEDEIALAGAASHGFPIVKSVEEAVKNKFLVIGATGAIEKRPIGRSELLAMGNETYLVSASSDQVEIELEDLEALAEGKEEMSLGGKKIGTKYVIR